MAKKVNVENKPNHRSMLAEAGVRLLHNRTAMFGLAIFLTIIILCALAGVICPEGYDQQDISKRFLPPGTPGYILGTDNLGRSLLARILYGGRSSLMIGFISTTLTVVIGVILGMIAGFYGGTVDDVIMRILDIFNAIPNLLLAICIAAVFGGSVTNCILAVGISGIPSTARMVRGPTLAAKGMEYVESAKSIDASDWVVIFKHIMPNISSVIIVNFTMGIGGSILIAASLSFLGLGVQPPSPEWGAMLSSAREFMVKYPYLVSIPGLSIAAVVFSMNLFGDGVRDALDPRLKY